MPRSLRNRPDQIQRLVHDIRPSTQLNPVRPQPPTFPTSISHPKDLNKLQLVREELNRQSWNSQPPSQASLAGSRSTSRQPSRQPSRNPSASSRHTSQSKMANRFSCPEYMYEDIEFHMVESHNMSHSNMTQVDDNSLHFPSITDRNHQRSRSHDSKDTTTPYHHHHTKHHTTRTNGHWSSSKQYVFDSERSTHDIISDLGKVVKSHNISCTDKKANTIYLKNQSTKLQVHVDKDDKKCLLNFQWLQGGTQEHYEKICSQIFSSLSECN